MISLNEEQQKLLKNEFKINHPFYSDNEIKLLINDFLQIVDPLFLKNIDEYLHNQPLTAIKVFSPELKRSITLKEVLTNWTKYEDEKDIYQSGYTINGLKLLSGYYRREIAFITLWYYYCRAK